MRQMFPWLDSVKEKISALRRKVDPGYAVDRGYVQSNTSTVGDPSHITMRLTRGNVRAQMFPLLPPKDHEQKLEKALYIKW